MRSPKGRTGEAKDAINGGFHLARYGSGRGWADAGYRREKQEEAKRYRFTCIGGGQRDSSSGARQNPVRRQQSEGDFRCLCFHNRKA
jgi:hypothetical protein